MPAAPADGSSESLAAAFADPAVLVDGRGVVVACNAAAEARFGLPVGAAAGLPIEALVGERVGTARRLALAEPGLGTLLVWQLDPDGLGPDDVALEKLAIIERISGPVSHEIKNAILPQQGFADLALGEPVLPPDLRELAANAFKAGALATELITAVFEFSRAESAACSLDRIVGGILALLKAPMLNMEHRAAVSDALPPIAADPSTVRHVLLAVVLNALEAQGTRWVRHELGVTGRLLISARHVDDARGNRVRVAIEDGAPTVPVDERAHLFSGEGAGRASRDLAVARALLQRVGGRISHEPVANGNRFVVDLPIVGAAPLVGVERGIAHQPALAPLVLVCDADPSIRALLVRFLARVGARAIEARDTDEALQLLAREPVVMVVADLGLDARGAALYDSAAVLRPDLASRFVLITADPAGSAATVFASRTGVPVLPKPFDHPRLEQVLGDTLRR